MLAAWDAERYLRFEDERSRPALELLQRVPLDRPRRVVDIGCGPGNSTELLLARYPDAEIVGLDSSPEMLASARKRLPDIVFVQADAAAWLPERPFDLIFSNATMQWVRGHLAVLERLMASLPSGGALAVQVPDNHAEPTHRLMREVAAEGPWHKKFVAPIAREDIAAPGAYYDRLRPLSASVDIWHTAYYHPLAGPAAIVDWVRGTGLRPFLARLDPAEQAAWLAEYEAKIAAAYPRRGDGKVLLRFPRLFMVAVRT